MDWHPKSNILDRKTPLLAGYPSAKISKQKLRRIQLSGLLRRGCEFDFRGLQNCKLLLVRALPGILAMHMGIRRSLQFIAAADKLGENAKT